jgi:hypothetical protein
MDSDESVPVVMDEGEKILLLLMVQLQCAAGIEQHGVKIVQVPGVVLRFFLSKHSVSVRITVSHRPDYVAKGRRGLLRDRQRGKSGRRELASERRGRQHTAGARPRA